MTTPADFFEALYAGQTGILELRSVPLADTPAARRLAFFCRDFVQVVDGHFDIRRVDRFIIKTRAHRMPSYFGVALRTAQAAVDRRGSAQYCGLLTALFVDCDFKHLGETESRKRLAAFAIPPSIIVNSGGGLHPYWVLRRPLDLQNGGLATARSLLQRLARSVADIVDTQVSEPVRVLRVPGSLNFKYTPPRLVVVEKL
jgi:hypothetical protein